MQDYQPIDCHLHDTYEIAIMHQTMLKLDWRQAGIRHRDRVRPVDLCTKDGAEWLLAEDSAGKRLSIRLDWIHEAGPEQVAGDHGVFAQDPVLDRDLQRLKSV